MFFRKGPATQYVDRGDVAAYDFDTGDFTKDDTWRTVYLAGIVGYKSLWIHCRLHFQVLQAERSIQFRTLGNSNEINCIHRRGYIANVVEDGEFWILTDYMGRIEYKMVTASYAALDLVVLGWYE